MLVDFILHKANGTDTVELNKSIDGYSVVLNPKLHDVYNQVSYVEFDVAMSMDNYIEIGDWIEVDGKKYYSLTNFASFNARIAKGGTYNVRFYSPEQWLYKANMYATNEIYSGGVYSWERVDNTIVTVGNLESFGRWLCWNTNAQQNTRMFKLGNVPTGMDEQYEVLDFNPANCLSALYSICKTYKVRYEVVPNTEASPDSQYIINFYDTDEVFPVTFKYEEENGLYKLELTGCDEEVYTQFEIAGSTENIPSSYRDTRLRLSESISALSILDYPDLYDKWGRSIKILTYENIKPTRTGTVTDIVVDDIYSFIDSSLIGATWSPVGGTIQVVEGPLMGFSFECDYFNSTNGRVHIKPMTESNGMELPSADLSYYRFTAGATPTRYNVVGIALPNEYIEDAEARLLAAAMNDTSYYSDIRASYSLAISGTLLEEGEYEINAGVLVPIQHLGIGLDRSVRVQSITYDLSKPKYYDIEEIQLSDFRQEGLMDMVTEGVRKSVATLKDVGYTNKLNTFANSVSTIKQGIAKSLGYGSWEDFMEKTWNGEGEEWSANTIIIENLINSDLINVNTLIAREAFVNTLLANELFISGVQNETESLVNNYLLYLTSSVATVACDSEGTVTGTLPTSTAIVYHGASADTGWSFSGELSGCTGSVNEGTGVITITGLTADDSTVTVSATKTDKPTLRAIFRISKVYAGIDGIDGEDGVDSVIYYITPSVDNVVKSMSGTLTPSSVTCAQYKVVGNAAPVAGDKTIKYKLSGGALTTYTEAVNIGAASYVDFFLYDGEVELWRTRVPVILDASDIEYIYDSFADGNTYVAGGLVLSSFIGVLDGTDAVVAGMAGKDFVLDGETPITSPMLFAGATTAQNANNAKFRVYQDGSIYSELGEIGGLTIAADKVYLGDGVYGGSTTPFYVDDDGQMSLKDKFKWDGTNLTINGGGTFSGLLDVGGIKIGLNAVSTGVDGLYIDENNYWDENGNFKAGNGTTYLLHDSATGSFTFNGKVTINSDTVFATGYSPSEIELAAKDYTDGEISGLGLGSLAYLDTVGKALLDETIISGGYINTSLIEARSIVAGKIAAGTITANEIKAGTITANEIKAGTITANEIKAGTITANEIKAGTITANEIDISSLTTDSAFITAIEAMTITADSLLANTAFLESLATKSAFIEELTGNTAFISALTVNSLTASDGDTSIDISNSAVSNACGLYLNKASSTLSAKLAYDSGAKLLSLQFTSPVYSSQMASDWFSIYSLDYNNGIRLSAGSGLGIYWGLYIQRYSQTAYLYVDSVPTLALRGNTYDTILNDTSLSIANDGAYLSSSKLKVSNLPSTTQSSGEFWKDSKGHVMVGAASSYTAADVGAVPTTRTVNSKALSADITLSASDVSAVPTTDIQYFTQAAWDDLTTTQKNAIKLAIVY